MKQTVKHIDTNSSLVCYDADGGRHRISLRSWEDMWCDIMDAWHESKSWAFCITIGLNVIYIERRD